MSGTLFGTHVNGKEWCGTKGSTKGDENFSLKLGLVGWWGRKKKQGKRSVCVVIRFPLKRDIPNVTSFRKRHTHTAPLRVRLCSLGSSPWKEEALCCVSAVDWVELCNWTAASAVQLRHIDFLWQAATERERSSLSPWCPTLNQKPPDHTPSSPAEPSVNTCEWATSSF